MPPELKWAVVATKGNYAAHLSATASLFEATFHRDFPAAAWDQYYFNNPYGDPIVSLAYAGSTLVAHQALIPGIASDGNVNIRYHLSMSTMVHPAHRASLAFIELFESVHRRASDEGSGFILGFPNANLFPLLGRCFGYSTIVESPLRNWTPPETEPAAISADPGLGRSQTGRFGPLFSTDSWEWRIRLNRACAAKVNNRLRVIYKLEAGATLTVLNVEGSDCEGAALDLAGLAAAERCPNVRITDYHASTLGIACTELISHENYRVRMSALPLRGPIPELQFNLLYCDIF